MPRLLMPLSLRYTSVVSLFGLLSVLNTCRHYLGKSGSYIRSITNGNALPSVRELFNIIMYFELTPSEFFSGLGSNSFSRAELYKKLGDLSDEDIEKVSLFVSWIQK